MTVRLIPTESGSAAPARVPIQTESSDETVTDPAPAPTPGPPDPATTHADATEAADHADPLPAAVDPPTDGRRALRQARSQRRRTALLCAVVLFVCLAVALLIVGLARDRAAPPAAALSFASVPAPTSATSTVPVPPQTRPDAAMASEGDNR
jgi:hypothetical protein